jgi:hypothetical protein
MARSSTFKQVDVKRAVSAARAVGITNPLIEIVTPNGTVIRVTGEQNAPSDKSSGENAEGNPLDRWIFNRADKD